MEQGNDTIDGLRTEWIDPPTVKARNAVHHAVGRLLDALAPEKPPARGAVPTAPAVQRLRSPRGCILQAATHAVSVSWCPAGTTELALGELQLITWRGTVSRPGATRRPGQHAEVVAQEVLRPVEVAPDAWQWRGADDATYDTAELTARCEAPLLDPPARAAS